MKVFSLKDPVPYDRYVLFQERSRSKRKESILFLEHPLTITGGINYNIGNLLRNQDFLSENGISLHYIKRGGDFTAHEPGQIVTYIHLDLKERDLGISEFLTFILDACIDSVKEVWDLDLVRDRDAPGLYLAKDPKRKILSMGVLFKSWFTSYGIALNVSNDFSAFQCIHPCGQDWRSMISISQLGLPSDPDKKKEWILSFRSKFLKNFQPIAV
ncbi:lipoyl(octanoyl) transferase [Leptospira langatensis]|uniref:Octanoyltransferase n=1 Tax=Leptospira langatensis TaxID=2484983 RepID=A0A5F1ZPD3_9LEPT|nr:lipoyl(octanoyl) transferase LipB [Leptospira langatensis]TGK05385.1 lipoyl(octanoyl) transferase [Leptospira langatensis]TGL38521.1 lipoyl(octanoyl) transferase [Leptospira langatensis]